MTYKLLTIKEAAEIAGVKPVTIHTWIRRGHIKPSKDRRGWELYVTRSSLTQWLAGRKELASHNEA